MHENIEASLSFIKLFVKFLNILNDVWKATLSKCLAAEKYFSREVDN